MGVRRHLRQTEQRYQSMMPVKDPMDRQQVRITSSLPRGNKLGRRTCTGSHSKCQIEIFAFDLGDKQAETKHLKQMGPHTHQLGAIKGSTVEELTDTLKTEICWSSLFFFQD